MTTQQTEERTRFEKYISKMVSELDEELDEKFVQDFMFSLHSKEKFPIPEEKLIQKMFLQNILQ